VEFPQKWGGTRRKKPRDMSNLTYKCITHGFKKLDKAGNTGKKKKKTSTRHI
jgi:hypothetical protein